MKEAVSKEKLRSLPDKPGVYLMKDEKGHVIYVGKAKNLKNRVKSYFTSAAQKAFRTAHLVQDIRDFDIIITKTELEALLTERTLIRSHAPKYNVLLRDDKEYPYLRVLFEEEWPRIEKVRRRKDDGAVYLGPFGSAGQLALALKTAGKVFPLIRCSRHEFEHTKRPCNYYHMNMCLAPCVKDVSRDTYIEMVRDAVSLLQGRNREVIAKLKTQMDQAAKDQRYELAAQYRDQLHALSAIGERQSSVVQNVQDADAIGFAREGERVAIHILMVRSGILMGSDHFTIRAPIQTDEEALQSFMSQYYDARFLPAEIILPFPLDDEDFQELMQSMRDEQMERGSKISLILPERGSKRDLQLMAKQNARYNLDEQDRKKSQEKMALKVVQESLNLPVLPERMECIDISNLQGSHIVASNVVFENGKPAKQHYRLYNVKTVEDGPDDFQSMYEVVKRRIERGLKEDNLPDLLVIDGGKGQLSSAKKAYDEYPELGFSLVSLAKSHTDATDVNYRSAPGRSDERIFFVDKEQPLPLKVGSPEYRLLTQLRDEAHRFAISHHRKKRNKATLTSELEAIPGIGPKLRTKLLQEFGAIEKIKQAPLERLQAIDGVSKTAAMNIYTWYRQDNEDATSQETNREDPNHRDG